ncbi:type II secretion system F family protein [Nesterenkonia alba]|uniref:type II secretion system F family protein n=1 Tax=Nesterenkonia alba TaxID=515814 RepID=UPI0003B62557|nr:type II secretion system F family protein [Nesterenkonia alba]
MNLILPVSVFAAVVAAVLLLMPGTQRTRTTSSPRLSDRLTGVRLGTGRKQHAHLRQDAAVLLRQLSALLQSGRAEGHAWTDLRDHWRDRDPHHPLAEAAHQVVSAEASGAGVAEGLRRSLAQQPPQEVAEVLHRLLAVSALSEQTGAPLARLVDRIAASLDEAAELQAAVEKESAGPKLTQLILSLLPLGGVVLGQLMGADPVAMLLGSGLGLVCLATGVGFLFLGRVWSGRMIRGVEVRP